MILVVGSSKDKVTPTLVRRLAERQMPYALINEDTPEVHSIRRERARQRTEYYFTGGDAIGERPVRAVLLRHAVARTLRGSVVEPLSELQNQANEALEGATCLVANRASCGYSNYSKPYQLQLLQRSGFDIPKTLVTNSPEQAKRFIDDCTGQVVFKGVSNVTTFAQLLSAENRDRLSLLRHCPTQFQEYLPGTDYRVHVVGNVTYACSLRSHGLDYRQAALLEGEEIDARPAVLPQSLLDRCVTFTRDLGLLISGIDFREDRHGVPRVLELNPYPQFTFYESRSGLPITDAVIDLLAKQTADGTNLFA